MALSFQATLTLGRAVEVEHGQDGGGIGFAVTLPTASVSSRTCDNRHRVGTCFASQPRVAALPPAIAPTRSLQYQLRGFQGAGCRGDRGAAVGRRQPTLCTRWAPAPQSGGARHVGWM